MIVSENLENWLDDRGAAERPVPGYVEDELRGYLECGLLCFGFARAVCMTCRTGLVVAFSCKGRGVCPSCNGRHMAQTAAHLADHVIPPVPVRQWVISAPKRLGGISFLHRFGSALNHHVHLHALSHRRSIRAESPAAKSRHGTRDRQR